ncbi:Maf-like protein [Paenibacillus albicereus]|uniref:dTTP/UTP pyrophosphatase n=1 Tax=Paenibacillus albicereus TaxID=2726185 RepID=A0A6H2GZT0_9BACL|nr:Maf family protein [Paenibacillus albicereus]QJC52944.1 Maf-like protein [Paenibacillus albicereus]
MNENNLPQRLVLASSSPRRRELAAALRLPIPLEVLATDADESVGPELRPHEIVAELALRKAMAAALRIEGSGGRALVLGGDTIVVLDGEVLGKPVDAEEARLTLRRLSGRVHEVYSGVALLATGGPVPAVATELPPAFPPAGAASALASDAVWGERQRFGGIGDYRVAAPGGPAIAACGYTRSKVRFRELGEAQIAAYVASGDPLDKAGSYGIQGLGSVLIEKIEGDFYSIMGLPLNLLYELLKSFGLDPLQLRDP